VYMQKDVHGRVSLAVPDHCIDLIKKLKTRLAGLLKVMFVCRTQISKYECNAI